ncbi:MAG TPA: hypothetical protein VFQ93_10265 [Casimicrobiaceae bacterium]|nr:hypothetical protein [Casimicrobiaceae bacterium]
MIRTFASHRLPPSGIVSAAFLLLFSVRTYAHGFGMRYDLPLPLNLWIIGAACTIVLSFFVISIAVRAASLAGPKQANLSRWQIDKGLTSPKIRLVAQVIAVAALALIVTAGILGDQTPTRNLAPTAIWIAWWVGFSYLSAFVGNVWSVVNPWAAVFDWCERFLLEPHARRRSRFDWPQRAGVWPAIALFIVFAWLELIWEGRSIPWNLAWLAIGFSLLTWTGMFIFGRSTWLAHADPFALAFGVLSKFGPTDIETEHCSCDTCKAQRGGARHRDRCHRSAESPGTVMLRPLGVGLIDTENVSRSLSVFVVVMLSTVTFDGVMATPVWQRIEGALYTALPVLGESRLAIINTAGLLAFCVIFIAVYRLFATLVARASGNRMTPDAAGRAFVLTLVPIAIAYLVAHYLSYFLIQGQLLIRLASDPFGFGWNIFGTAQFRPDIGIVGARFMWYTSLVAIVLGHVAAVALAHIVALRRIEDRRLAMRSQIPMLVLMIAYTMVSLWIIAQPIVE